MKGRFVKIVKNRKVESENRFFTYDSKILFVTFYCLSSHSLVYMNKFSYDHLTYSKCYNTDY